MSTCAELATKLQGLQNALQHVFDENAKQKIEDEIEQVVIAQNAQGCLKQQTPWAVLLCKFKDNLSEPITSQLAQKLFTSVGADTYNMTHFFHDVSHGNLDLSGSQVFGWFTVDVNVNDLMAPTDPPPPGWKPKINRDAVMALAKQTASNQGVSLGTFFGVVLVFNVAVGGPQGGSWGGISPNVGVFSDYRYVQGNGSESYGQEMGHSYGLDHSRSDDPNLNICDSTTLDYRDPWDGMSTACAYSAPDPDFGARGPGFNAWNIRGRGWLDESRVWRGSGNTFDQVVQLIPLLRHDLPGLLAAELPPLEGSHGRYLVEFRIKDGWDAAIPRSAVLVHRFEGVVGQFLGDHSYIMSGTRGNQDLAEGDVFAPWGGGGPRLEVQKIDENAKVATVRLSYAPLMTDVAPDAAAAGDYVFFFAKSIDGRIFYNRAKLGQGLEGWVEVGGGGRTNASPAAAAIGTYMYIAVRGLDGNIYINQTGDLGQSFIRWNSANFSTDVAPAIAVAGDYAFFFAKHPDGRIFYNRAKLGQGLEGWVEVGGGGRTNASPSAAAVGTYMYIAVRGLDGNIYINQTGDLGQSFIRWSSANFNTDVAPAAVAAGDYVFFFAKHPDGRIFHNRAKLGQGLEGWIEVGGLTTASPAAAAVGTYMYIAVRGLDGNIYINQTGDLGQSFTGWSAIT